MNYYTHVESNRFRVKDPKKFKEDFDTRVGGDEVDLAVFEDGFQFWATNPYISDPAYDESTHQLQHCQMDELDIADVIQPHLKDKEVVLITYVNRSSKDSQLGASFCVVSNVGQAWKNGEEILGEMSATLFPQHVLCATSGYNKELDIWLEKDKSYLALTLTSKRGRQYYEIAHQGHRLQWNKEYFNGGTN